MLNTVINDPQLLSLEASLALEMDVEMYEEAATFDMSMYDNIMADDIERLEKEEGDEE